MKKSEFLQQVQDTRAKWDDLLAQAPEDRMEDSGAAGKWTVKDIVAHITWGEKEMIGVIRSRALAGSDLWNASQTERNEVVYLENRDRALQEVLDEARQVYADLFEALTTLSEEDLNDAHHFAQMPESWQPWQVFASNTYEHYLEHIPSVRTWLDSGLSQKS